MRKKTLAQITPGVTPSNCHALKYSETAHSGRCKFQNIIKLSHIVKSREVKILTKMTYIRAIQSITKDFQYRFLINIHIFPLIHGPSMLFHLTLITLLADRWFCRSCVKGFYPTAATKNENIICSWINLACGTWESFSIFKKSVSALFKPFVSCNDMLAGRPSVFRDFLGARSVFSAYLLFGWIHNILFAIC